MENPYTHFDKYGLRHLPEHLASIEHWAALTDLLCDLKFVAVKCAESMTYELVSDYNLALALLPETWEEKQAEEKHKERIEKYINKLIAFAKGQTDSFSPLPSVAPRSDENIEQETKRIIRNPSRLDRIRAFARFVKAESHGLVKFGSIPGFCFQQAYNFSKSGPVSIAADKLVDVEKEHAMFLLKSSRRIEYNFHSPIRMTIEGHKKTIFSMHITPNGKIAATGSADGTIRIWNLQNGSCLLILDARDGIIKSCYITPDSETVVSASNTGNIHIWDMKTGKQVKKLRQSRVVIEKLIATPDASIAVTSNFDSTIRIWDFESNRCIHTLEGFKPKHACISANGKKVAAVHGKAIAIMDRFSGKEMNRLIGHTSDVTCLEMTPDAKIMISGSSTGNLRVWDTESRKCVTILKGHTDNVRDISITPDGKIFISVCDDYTMRIWDRNRGECLKEFKTWNNRVRISADARIAVTGSCSNIRVWDIQFGSNSTTVENHNEGVESLLFSGNGKILLSGSSDRTLKIWNTDTGKCRSTIEGYEKEVSKARITPDNENIVTAEKYRSIWVHKVQTGDCIGPLKAHQDRISAMGMTPDGILAVTGSYDKTIKIWEIESGRCRKTLEHKNVVKDACITPDGRKIVLAGRDKELKVWDMETGVCLRTLAANDGDIQCCGILPDGKVAITGNSDSKIAMWRIENGECLGTFHAHESGVKNIHVSTDGRKVASIFDVNGYNIKVWNLRTRRYRTMKGHQSYVAYVSLMPDGKKMISISPDKTVRLWDMENGKMISVYQAEKTIFSISQVRADMQFACGSGTGEVFFIYIKNMANGCPITTPVRIWRYKIGCKGSWDNRISGLCAWCGQRFPVSESMLSTIRCISREACIDSNQYPCLELPDEAWDEDRLLSECALCKKPLKFNPFIVDNQDMY